MTSKQFLYIAAPFVSFLLLLGMCMPKRTPLSEASQVEQLYERHITQLDSSLVRLFHQIRQNAPDASIHQAFFQARVAYKRIEFITAYYNPYTAKAINGPAISEVEEDDPLQKIIPPTGFQVAEELLFPAYNPADKEALMQEIKLIQSSLNRLRLVNESTIFDDSHIFDAMRQQIFRIMTLGISGFDSPVALYSLPEASASLQTLQEIVNLYLPKVQQNSPSLATELNGTFTRAIAHLNASKDFDSFNRADFMVSYAHPLSKSLHEARRVMGIAIPNDLRALSPEAATLFDEGVFNVNFYAPGYQAHLTPERIALGNMLFFDPILSGNDSRSCASCHHPQKAFTDGRAKSIAFDLDGVVSRNAPTLLNAALQKSLFHDMRVDFLEDQADDVLRNEKEMHGSFAKAAQDLAQSPVYNTLFAAAFAEASPHSLTEENIKIAIASYVRSLISLNSRFDQYMRGDQSKMNQVELKGFTLFMGKAKCGTCHFMPLFNGTVPPDFGHTEAEILGVPATTDTGQPVLDKDSGKFALNNRELHKFAFKTPTIRNIALTAPYMHNGVYASLEEVINFYDQGGGQGLGIDIPTQTLPAVKLDLTKEEKQAILAFMHTLTDTTGLTSPPQVLPSFPGKLVLTNRKIGGKY